MESVFTLPDTFKYPSDNFECFEDYFIRTFRPNGEPREFIKVAWTAFYRRASYGKDEGMKRTLQKEFLNKLDPGKKYFTVVTWDDGIMNSLDHLDVQVFAACGPRIDFPIPLLCQPHKFPPAAKRDIICSFVGSNNHPIRDRIIKELTGEKGFYISTKGHNMQAYCNILSRSKYVLCPRGYGITSFRICEAIQYGAIPIYISDRMGYIDQAVIAVLLKDPSGIRNTIMQIIKGGFKTYPEIEDAFKYHRCRQMIIENIKP